MCNLALQQLLERLHPSIDSLVCLLARATTFDQLIEFVLDKNLFERGRVPLSIQLVELNLQLLFQQRFGVLGRAAQNLTNAQEMRLILIDYTRVGRNRNLAIGECVQCVDRLVGRFVGCHVNNNLNLLRGVVLHLANLDLTLFVGLNDRLLDTLGCSRKGNLGDGQRALVDLRNACANLHRTATQTVIITRAIDQTTRR